MDEGEACDKRDGPLHLWARGEGDFFVVEKVGREGGEGGGEGGKKMLYQMWFGRIYMFGGE